MLRKEILKYVLDIESVISELDSIIKMHDFDYDKFSSDFVSIRPVERDLMIIGEATGKIIDQEPDIKISSAKHIIGLRNLIVHAYDSIDPTTLWRILIKDIPVLKEEIRQIKA